MNKPIVLLGAGGHASVLLEILISQNREIIAVVAPDIHRKVFSRYQCFNEDDSIYEFDKDQVLLVNGIGFLSNGSTRKKLYEKFSEKNYSFETVVANQAVVSPTATINQGAQIMHGAIVQTGAFIGSNTIINTKASVDHDCIIGKHNHIAPSATLCGAVHTGNSVFIGAGTTLIQEVVVGDDAFVGAGAMVAKSLADNEKVYGYRS